VAERYRSEVYVVINSRHDRAARSPPEHVVVNDIFDGADN